MKKIYIMCCLLIIIRLSSACFAETADQGLDKSESSEDTKKNFHLEIGGNYNWLNKDNGKWKAFDIKLQYSGFKKVMPELSVSRLTRREGSQLVYSFGSYIFLNPEFYMTVGVSGAPVKDPNVTFYPKLRLDLSGYYNTQIIDGLVLSTGITHFPKQNGTGSDIIYLGGIYYGKVILTMSLNYNIAQPGNITSLSGQAGIMYGSQGKYWTGGGINIGRVAYRLPSTIPLDVHYKSHGAHIFYKKWLGKNWGINNRLDYQKQVGFYNLFGITSSFFFDF